MPEACSVLCESMQGCAPVSEPGAGKAARQEPKLNGKRPNKHQQDPLLDGRLTCDWRMPSKSCCPVSSSCISMAKLYTSAALVILPSISSSAGMYLQQHTGALGRCSCNLCRLISAFQCCGVSLQGSPATQGEGQTRSCSRKGLPTSPHKCSKRSTA